MGHLTDLKNHRIKKPSLLAIGVFDGVHLGHQHLFSNLIKTSKDNINYTELFKLSTKEALVAFKGKKILIGRARMFEDKTKKFDDPGMFALSKLSEVF